MKTPWVSLLACAAVLFAEIAHAGSANDALIRFGLVGTWSPDCARDVHRACEKVSDCAARVTFSAPSNGDATRTSVNSVPNRTPVENTLVIDKAEMITNEKIRYSYVVQGIVPDSSTILWVPENGERWIFVLEKVGAKFRVVDSANESRSKLAVVSGAIYRPVDPKIGEMPKEWKSTGVESPLWEKCLNQ
jgi:hypothetical protein